MLRVAIKRIRPEKEARLRAWLAELNSRADEVRETFRDETVRAEQAFIVAGSEGPLLVYVMEAADFDRGAKAYASSRHQIDAEHREIMRECLLESAKIEPLYDVASRGSVPLQIGPGSMQLAANIFDVWVFRRRGAEAEFLLLYTSVEKATRYFNGGRFWQIPSSYVSDGESITEAISRVLDRFGLRPKSIWAGEHAYLIYNRRFAQMQAIGVYAAEVDDATVRLDPTEHSEFAWLSREKCLDRVHYRGLKDGLQSVHDYVTGVDEPAKELCLYVAPGA